MSYYDWWRQRLDFVEGFPSSRCHEANLLLWASADALAGAWFKAQSAGAPTPLRKVSDRRRMGDYLARYGNDAFRKVSAPWLWHGIADVREQLGPADFASVLSLGRVCGPAATMPNCLRGIEADPLTTEALQRLGPVADREVRRQGKKTTVREIVLSARFGEIANQQMRNALVHEGQPGPRSHGYNMGSEGLTAPTYMSGANECPPMIGFSFAFVLSTLRTCLDGMEEELPEAEIRAALARPR